MNLKLRMTHHTKLPRHLIYNVMTDLDPQGKQDNCIKKEQKNEKTFHMRRTMQVAYLTDVASLLL